MTKIIHNFMNDHKKLYHFFHSNYNQKILKNKVYPLSYLIRSPGLFFTHIFYPYVSAYLFHLTFSLSSSLILSNSF